MKWRKVSIWRSGSAFREVKRRTTPGNCTSIPIIRTDSQTRTMKRIIVYLGLCSAPLTVLAMPGHSAVASQQECPCETQVLYSPIVTASGNTEICTQSVKSGSITAGECVYSVQQEKCIIPIIDCEADLVFKFQAMFPGPPPTGIPCTCSNYSYSDSGPCIGISRDTTGTCHGTKYTFKCPACS